MCKFKSQRLKTETHTISYRIHSTSFSYITVHTFYAVIHSYETVLSTVRWVEYISIFISILQLPSFCTELHAVQHLLFCQQHNMSICMCLSVCVWESERSPVVSSCCLRGSQRLPPWNRRRRGTELGSDRPTKTPLQRLLEEKQDGASAENTFTILSKYDTGVTQKAYWHTVFRQ